MPSRAHPALLAVAASLLAAQLAACAPLALPTGQADRSGQLEAPGLAIIHPDPIPFASEEIVNPLRGLYRWADREVAPQPRPALDAYRRFTWRELEPAEGQYDFSLIDARLAEVAAAGGKFGFRVRAMINRRGLHVPDYLPDRLERGWWGDADNDGEADTYIPDWNDPDFFARAEALLSALSARYDGDPRVAFIDIGLYGNWGEWHMWPFKYPAPGGAERITLANRQRLIDMHLAAFPRTRLLMPTTDEEALDYALQRSPTLGWRRDSLGSPIFVDSTPIRRLKQNPAAWARFTERWKTAPVVTEFINPNDQTDPEVYRLALAQAREFHVSMVSNGNTLDWDELSAEGRHLFLELGKSVGYRYELQTIMLPAQLAAGRSQPVVTIWRNLGNAPTYESWRVALQLRPAGGPPVWEQELSPDLGSILPGASPTQHTDQIIIPADLAPGPYSLTLIVSDRQAYRPPLALAIEGQLPDGAYLLGQTSIKSP